MAFINVYFSLGSNLGDRRRNIVQAVGLMDKAFGGKRVSLSKLIETKPMGFSGGKFLNAAALYRIFKDDSPPGEACIDILHKIKEIEREMGRTDAPEYDKEGKRIYHSRTIDIDILFYGSERIDCEELVVPHKGISERPFVMVPLMEIAKPSLKEAFPEYFNNQ